MERSGLRILKNLIKGLKLSQKNFLFGEYRFNKLINSRFLWYRGYYPHRARNVLFPVFGIFIVDGCFPFGYARIMEYTFSV